MTRRVCDVTLVQYKAAWPLPFRDPDHLCLWRTIFVSTIGPTGPFMLDIFGPAGPSMYQDQIFCYRSSQ